MDLSSVELALLLAAIWGVAAATLVVVAITFWVARRYPGGVTELQAYRATTSAAALAFILSSGGLLMKLFGTVPQIPLAPAIAVPIAMLLVAGAAGVIPMRA